jgi:hypothetical protein
MKTYVMHLKTRSSDRQIAVERDTERDLRDSGVSHDRIKRTSAQEEILIKD